MPRTSTKILLAFLICTLPSLGGAAETAPAATTNKPAAPVQSVAPAPTAPAAPAQPPTATTPTPIVPTPSVTAVPKAAEVAKPQQLRLGFVDIARVGTESTLGKASASQAKQRQEKLQAQILSKRKQLDKQKAALEAQFPTLNPTQRETKSKEFQKKVENFQKYGMKSEKELQALQEGLSKAFNEAVEQAAIAYGKTNGLALVVVKREMLYLSNSVDAQDVTEGIIKLMNEKWTKK
jgi:outer membrane protein